MKQLLIGIFLVVGVLIVLFHARITEFQMEMYRRWLPLGASSPILRALYDAVLVLVGIGFIASAVGYFVGILR